MGDLIAYPPPRARDDGTGLVGMVIFLASWAMLFAALFFAYGLVRLRSPVWPPLDQPALPIGLPAVNTGVLALSSLALQLGLVSLRSGRLGRLVPCIALSFFLGILFLGLQGTVWLEVFGSGIKPSSGPYASVFYGLTWLHAAHVLVGVVALAYLFVRALQGAYNTPRHLPVRLWAMYWHFVGAVWALMFVTVYLI